MAAPSIRPDFEYARLGNAEASVLVCGVELYPRPQHGKGARTQVVLCLMYDIPHFFISTTLIPISSHVEE